PAGAGRPSRRRPALRPPHRRSPSLGGPPTGRARRAGRPRDRRRPGYEERSCSFRPDVQHHMNRCAPPGGVDLEPASELPHPLAHSEKAHTEGPDGVAPAQDLRGQPPALINYLQGDPLQLSNQLNPGRRAPRVSLDIGEALLDDAEQGGFYFLGKAAEVGG